MAARCHAPIEEEHSLSETRVVDIIDPDKVPAHKVRKRSVSKNVQSAMIVLVRSARSFFPKNDRGIFAELFRKSDTSDSALHISGEIRGIILKPGSGQKYEREANNTARRNVCDPLCRRDTPPCQHVADKLI